MTKIPGALKFSYRGSIRYNAPMRRLIAILLMLLVPLQFAWSAIGNVHGHFGDAGAALGFHVHDDGHGHNHGGAGGDDRDGGIANGLAQDHDGDCHHDGHYHPVFSLLLPEHRLRLGLALADGPPLPPLPSFTSHIPALFDWPPSVPA